MSKEGPEGRNAALLLHLRETREALTSLLEQADQETKDAALGELNEVAEAAGGIVLPISREDLRALATATFLGYRADQLHGMHMGHEAPNVVSVVIENSPGDELKIETGKTVGGPYVDRRQGTSCKPPAYYGYIPRTCCHDGVTELFLKRLPNAPEGSYVGDTNHLDVMVVSTSSERANNTMITGRPVGVIHGIDPKRGRLEVDPKIICVAAHDRTFKDVHSLADLERVRPGIVEDEIIHFLEYYKQTAGKTGYTVLRGSEEVESAEAAKDMIQVSHNDWGVAYPHNEGLVKRLAGLAMGLSGEVGSREHIEALTHPASVAPIEHKSSS